jgi:hypothetical protein
MRAVSRTMPVVVLAVIASTAPVQAAGFITTVALHVHSGLLCVPNPGDAAKLAFNLSEGIRNTSTSATATALCPADNVLLQQDGGYVGAPQAVRVRVIDRSSAAAVRCTLKAFVANNAFPVSNTFPVRSSTGSVGGIQTLQWTAADGINISNYSFRVSCALPAASSSGQSAVQQTEVETRNQVLAP